MMPPNKDIEHIRTFDNRIQKKDIPEYNIGSISNRNVYNSAKLKKKAKLNHLVQM